MLKKELCIRCWKDYYESYIHQCGLYGKDWKERTYIHCPIIYLGKGECNVRPITDKPPSKCPFLLEHIITNQEKEPKRKN